MYTYMDVSGLQIQEHAIPNPRLTVGAARDDVDPRPDVCGFDDVVEPQVSKIMVHLYKVGRCVG